MKPLDERPKNIAPLAFGFECALAIIAALLGWAWGHSPLTTLEFTHAGLLASEWACAWGVVASAPPIVAFFAIDRSAFTLFRPLKELVDDQLLPLFAESALWELALVALAAGVGEELLFRGLLQDAVARWIGGTAGVCIGLGAASVVFGLCHAVNKAYAVLATLMGLYLGLLFCLTNHILVPVVTHFVYDFVVLLYLLRNHRAAPRDP